MNKKVIILNGAARKNGNTAKLVEAVTWYRTYENRTVCCRCALCRLSLD